MLADRSIRREKGLSYYHFSHQEVSFGFSASYSCGTIRATQVFPEGEPKSFCLQIERFRPSCQDSSDRERDPSSSIPPTRRAQRHSFTTPEEGPEVPNFQGLGSSMFQPWTERDPSYQTSLTRRAECHEPGRIRDPSYQRSSDQEGRGTRATRRFPTRRAQGLSVISRDGRKTRATRIRPTSRAYTKTGLSPCSWDGDHESRAEEASGPSPACSYRNNL